MADTDIYTKYLYVNNINDDYSWSIALWYLYNFFEAHPNWTVIDKYPAQEYWDGSWLDVYIKGAGDLLYPYIVIRSNYPWPGTTDYQELFILAGNGRNVSQPYKDTRHYITYSIFHGGLIASSVKNNWDENITHTWTSTSDFNFTFRRIGSDFNNYENYTSVSPRPPVFLYFCADAYTVFVLVTNVATYTRSSDNDPAKGATGFYVGAFNSYLSSSEDPYPSCMLPTAITPLTWDYLSADFEQWCTADTYANELVNNRGYLLHNNGVYSWVDDLHIEPNDSDAPGRPNLSMAQDINTIIETPVTLWGPAFESSNHGQPAYWGTLKFLKKAPFWRSRVNGPVVSGVTGLGSFDTNAAGNRMHFNGFTFPWINPL